LERVFVKFGFRGKASSPTKQNQIIMFVPGMFLIGGMFKSSELNAFAKLELLKILLSFSHPWDPTSISVKQQFASATPNNHDFRLSPGMNTDFWF
jgi:hypothetical protein